MPVRTVIIKKYENRRLYDTSTSRYVNLDDIAQMVREGTDVQVIDATSGEDLTRMVLAQIIAENAKVSDSAFPVDMLRQMVMASGRVGSEGLLGYMKAMSEMYQNTFRTFVPGTAGAAQETAAGPQQSGDPVVDELRRRVEDLERMVEKNSTKAAGDKQASRQKRR
jgi:polyhydroxyalkanoate synthesis repressor PhaR